MNSYKGGFKPLFFIYTHENQRYENHTRYFAFHHFVITPLTLLFLGWTVGKMDFSSREVALEGAYLFIGAFVLFLLPLL
uniref:DUF6526 family protein n=1 Tax=Algoriphagus sp. TaxID=1872435 RepID=UPI0040485210